MKRILSLAVALAILAPLALFGQDRQALRAAEHSFSSAERSYRNDDFKDAASSYEIVLESISSRSDSRKHIEMKLDANIKLVEIYFHKSPNTLRACELIQEYRKLIGDIRHTGVLRGRDLAKYLDQEKEFDKYNLRCDTRNDLDKDSDAFKRKFEEEFGEE